MTLRLHLEKEVLGTSNFAGWACLRTEVPLPANDFPDRPSRLIDPQCELLGSLNFRLGKLESKSDAAFSGYQRRCGWSAYPFRPPPTRSYSRGQSGLNREVRLLCNFDSGDFFEIEPFRCKRHIACVSYLSGGDELSPEGIREGICAIRPPASSAPAQINLQRSHSAGRYCGGPPSSCKTAKNLPAFAAVPTRIKRIVRQRCHVSDNQEGPAKGTRGERRCLSRSPRDARKSPC